jgi:hypothetical protein
MKGLQSLIAVVGSAVMVALLVSAVVRAHPMTYQGTVLAVQSAKLQVKTVDGITKKEAEVWFVVAKDTKVKRGDKTVSYADAKITAGERIVVIVDMDAETKMLAEEIRLAAK